MAVVERRASYYVKVYRAGEWEHIGSFNFAAHGGKRKAKLAAEAAEAEAKARYAPRTNETCDEFAARWPDDYPIVKTGPTRGRRKADGTLARYRQELKPFIAEFRGVRLSDVDRRMARRFATAHPRAAATVRGMFADAFDDRLVASNPFSGLQLEEKKGRSELPAITVDELHDLADAALVEHGLAYGSVYRALILFAGYVGARLNEAIHVEARDLHFERREVDLRVAKFDKPRTVLFLQEAQAAIRDMPRLLVDGPVFYSKRGRPLTATSHFAIWNPIRAAWWAKLSPARRDELVDFDFHSLRHFTGHHFYITLGLGEELAAYQLGHADPSLIRKRYGKPYQGALKRLKQGTSRPAVVPMRERAAREQAG